MSFQQNLNKSTDFLSNYYQESLACVNNDNKQGLSSQKPYPLTNGKFNLLKPKKKTRSRTLSKVSQIFFLMPIRFARANTIIYVFPFSHYMNPMLNKSYTGRKQFFTLSRFYFILRTTKILKSKKIFFSLKPKEKN